MIASIEAAFAGFSADDLVADLIEYLRGIPAESPFLVTTMLTFLFVDPAVPKRRGP